MEAAGQKTYHVGEFDGPLDLLLFLVRKNEVNIYDIPVALITEQYLTYLKNSQRPGLDDMTEFYIMAATLLYIKSRMLLPIPDDGDDSWDDPRRELVEKLIEHQKFRQLGEMLSDTYEESEWTVERKKQERFLPFEEKDAWDKITIWDLLKSFNGIMKGLTPEAVFNLYEEISVNEKITLVYEFLEKQNSFLFLDLVTRPQSPMDVVCAFLAVLELVKGKRIAVFQNKLFGEIQIRGLIEEGEGE